MIKDRDIYMINIAWIIFYNHGYLSVLFNELLLIRQKSETSLNVL